MRVDRRENVAVVTLDHPADRNALSLTMTRALAEAVHQVTSDDGIGAMVLTATGTAFCAASDGRHCAPDSAGPKSRVCRRSRRVQSSIRRPTTTAGS
ncbi:MAG: enoyl-CoA hydratase/isomerase family protein [Acidimicrobiales bacterium]